ncbi:MAG: ThuA domain-containing protein [Candidatus Hydrogenedentes bacterium]|nr:ThuA domain-containing protein [Candidatus Hydrogenedentota bacterium]
MKQMLVTTVLCGVLLGALGAFSAAAQDDKKIVLIAGRPSHGPGEHEFNAGMMLIEQRLKNVPGVEALLVKGGWPEDVAVFDGAAALVFYMDGGGGHPILQDDHLQEIGALIDRGVGLMCMHYGVEVPADKGGPEFQKWIGGYYETNWSCNPMWEPEFTGFPEHPITNGVKPFTIRDEWYFNMRFRPDMEGVLPILAAKPSDAVREGTYVHPKGPYEHIAKAKGRDEVMMWAVERPDGGRGVGFTGGHFHKNWGEDNFRKVVLNAILWTAKADVPENGVVSKVTEEELAANLDPKGKK